MIKRFTCMTVIWLFTALAWITLSGTVHYRTHNADRKIKQKVGTLWGIPQVQKPLLAYRKAPRQIVRHQARTKEPAEKRETEECQPLPLEKSEVNSVIHLDHRKKGLLWYATYTVDFRAHYTIVNDSRTAAPLILRFPLPDANGIYDNFRFECNGHEVDQRVDSGWVLAKWNAKPGEKVVVTVAYRSFGQEAWEYQLGAGRGTGKIKNITCTVVSNFRAIDFPDGTLSPTEKEKTTHGWKLTWRYRNLMTGGGIGLAMEQKINPGPFVERITQFAPVCLLFFFFVLLIVGDLQGIRLNCIQTFFLACAFFSFHLLFAYLVDHLNLGFSFTISALVSIFLVLTYLYPFVKFSKFLFEVGLFQLIYLILFSWSFFFKGYTGLIVTIGAIITLFITMQLTARHVTRRPDIPGSS